MPELKIEETSVTESTGTAPPVIGVWRISYDGLIRVDASASGPAVVLVPTEDVLMLSVPLPIANRTQRAQALPFAIEDQVSEPLEALHVALGAETTPGTSLAGVVRHDRMIEWCSLIDAAGLSGAAVIPDALGLPAPGPGFWSVSANDGRVLVRSADGTGFAVPEPAFAMIWTTANSPGLVSYGGALPDGIVASPPGPGWTGQTTVPSPILLNLRQGRYAPVSVQSPWLRRLAIVVGLGLLAHIAILALDTVALMRAADARRDEVATLVAAAGGPTTGDLAATAEAMLPTSVASTGFLPIFSRAAGALQPVGSAIALQSLTYAERSGLLLGIEASDLAGLQQAESALRSAGLEPVAGGAKVEGGRASQELTLGAKGGQP